MEVYAHDPLLASRLLVMAHYRLTPAQLKEIGDDDLALMDFSHRLYERRWGEILTDTFGLLLGSSWPVNSDLGVEKHEIVEMPHEKLQRWSLRDRADRISIPLSFVIGGESFVKHMKTLVSKKRLQQRKDPSVLNHPGRTWAEGDLVDLSSVPKEQFLKVASRVK